MSSTCWLRAYHLTLREEADAIISRGFRDSLPAAVAGRLHKGVWLSDESEANEGDVAIEIQAPAGGLDPYAISGREWCVPATVVNQWPRRVRGPS